MVIWQAGDSESIDGTANYIGEVAGDGFDYFFQGCEVKS